MNKIQTWLALIGTPERARKLRQRVDSLRSPVLDTAFGPEPAQCPTTILLGGKRSQQLYALPAIRPALDAWDTGEISALDLRRFCMYVEKGYYDGPVVY